MLADFDVVKSASWKLAVCNDGEVAKYPWIVFWQFEEVVKQVSLI